MARTTDRKTGNETGGHLRPRLGQEPGHGGEDLHIGADKRHGGPLRTPGADHHRTLPGGGTGLVEEPPRVSSGCWPTPERGRFDTIVCWKSDRLSRGMYPRAVPHGGHRGVPDRSGGRLGRHRHEDLRPHGGPSERLSWDNFRERASMGKRGSAKQGRIPVNNVPYGYRLGEGRRPVVEESEAEVVRRVFHMCVREDMGAPAIAKQLTAEGVPTPRAVGKWLDGHRHPHSEARGIPRHLVVRQAPPCRHRARDEEIQPAGGRVGRGSLPADRGR